MAAPVRTRSPSAGRRGVDYRLVLSRTIIILAGAAVLELAARSAWLPPTFVAAPTRVVGSLVKGFSTGSLVSALWETTTEVALALLLSGVVGLTLGYVLWRSRVLGEAFMPMLTAMFSSPVILLYPIALVLFGRTHRAIVVQATAYGVLPIIVYTVRALSEVPQVLHRVSDVECLSAWQRARLVMVPAAAPTLATGLRLGVTYILISVVAMEFLVQIGGLGQLIQLSALRFDIPGVYAHVLAVVVLTSVVISGLQAIERRVQQ